MKVRLLVGGLALLAAGVTASFADTPASTQTPAAQPAPATSSAPADSQTPTGQATPPAQGQPADAQPDPNEKICKKDETTGSRISKICKTRKEWDDEKKNGGGDF